ncbi:MAG: DUF4160 domain-containing protein [Planctomycetota bacterium]
MPRISYFFGISIYIYHQDHAPPHFHAKYAGEEAAIIIASLDIMDGSIHPRARGLVIEWAVKHQAELQRAWRQAQAQQSVDPIEPLD